MPASVEFYAQEMFTRRPEQLSVAEFVQLTNMVEQEMNAHKQ
jgi:ribosomal RNA small subunit methyltransferase A